MWHICSFPFTLKAIRSNVTCTVRPRTSELASHFTPMCTGLVTGQTLLSPRATAWRADTRASSVATHPTWTQVLSLCFYGVRTGSYNIFPLLPTWLCPALLGGPPADLRVQLTPSENPLLSPPNPRFLSYVLMRPPCYHLYHSPGRFFCLFYHDHIGADVDDPWPLIPKDNSGMSRKANRLI